MQKFLSWGEWKVFLWSLMEVGAREGGVKIESTRAQKEEIGVHDLEDCKEWWAYKHFE